MTRAMWLEYTGGQFFMLDHWAARNHAAGLVSSLSSVRRMFDF